MDSDTTEKQERKRKYQSLRNMTSPEKKKWRKSQQKKSTDTRVRIGAEQFERWCILKTKLGLKTDPEVATYLLNSHFRSAIPCSPVAGAIRVTSTPASHHDQPSASSSTPQLDLSVDYEERGDYVIPQDTPGTFDRESDPDYSSESECSEDTDVSDDINISQSEFHDEEPDINLDDVLEFEESHQHQGEELDDDKVETSSSSCAEDSLFIAYHQSISELLVECRPQRCATHSCTSLPHEGVKFVGTAAVVKWICDKGHVSKKWRSQPKLKGNNAGDVAVSAAVIFSGNNYAKIRMMFKFMNMGICHEALHSYIQRTYTFPAIEAHWKQLQDDLLQARKGKKVIISGDGRNDSPGHSAQYCTYTVMDNDTGDILAIKVIDKRQVDYKSTNMEKKAFVQALEFLKTKDIHVEEVITEAHPQIKAYVKLLEDVFHSFDVWHGATNVGKKLSEVAKKSKNRPLLPWIGEVTKHFWYCSQHADGSEEMFLALWRGLLHHVTGKHEWALGDGVGPAGCQHGDLPPDGRQKELEPDSPAHVALREIVLDPNLIKKLPYYTRFRHTSDLENFQSHVLVYAAKRFAYGPPSYKARNLLAGIDYQHHKGRKQKEKEDGPVFTRKYSKSAGRWTRAPVMEKKNYSYIPQLMKDVFVRRLSDVGSQRDRLVLTEEDPRRISGTIAPNEPPSVQELVQSH